MFLLKTLIPRTEASKEKHELEGGWGVFKPEQVSECALGSGSWSSGIQALQSDSESLL